MKFVIINDILYNPRYIKAIKPDKVWIEGGSIIPIDSETYLRLKNKLL